MFVVELSFPENLWLILILNIVFFSTVRADNYLHISVAIRAFGNTIVDEEFFPAVIIGAFAHFEYSVAVRALRRISRNIPIAFRALNNLECLVAMRTLIEIIRILIEIFTASWTYPESVAAVRTILIVEILGDEQRFVAVRTLAHLELLTAPRTLSRICPYIFIAMIIRAA
ncbi:MAG: hypothetical protein Q7K54_05225 [Candidatus Parcubacteria bacterium]|nr:hypothetical protein [Candidatus Parcubacteria bacterium]